MSSVALLRRRLRELTEEDSFTKVDRLAHQVLLTQSLDELPAADVECWRPPANGCKGAYFFPRTVALRQVVKAINAGCGPSPTFAEFVEFVEADRRILSHVTHFEVGHYRVVRPYPAPKELLPPIHPCCLRLLKRAYAAIPPSPFD